MQSTFCDESLNLASGIYVQSTSGSRKGVFLKHTLTRSQTLSTCKSSAPEFRDEPQSSPHISQQKDNSRLTMTVRSPIKKFEACRPLRSINYPIRGPNLTIWICLWFVNGTGGHPDDENEDEYEVENGAKHVGLSNEFRRVHCEESLY
jgi:hypothetical protein